MNTKSSHSKVTLKGGYHASECQVKIWRKWRDKNEIYRFLRKNTRIYRMKNRSRWGGVTIIGRWGYHTSVPISEKASSKIFQLIVLAKIYNGCWRLSAGSRPETG